MKLVIFSALVSSFLFSFSPITEFYCGKTGLKGHVFLVKGNQMPSPDSPPAVPKGVKTSLFIYELTNINQVSREAMSAFYSHISTRLIKEIQTDENGYFKVKLKPGLYSLFVKKGDLFYSSQFDEKNNIHPVEVKKGDMTDIVFQANYDAVY